MPRSSGGRIDLLGATTEAVVLIPRTPGQTLAYSSPILVNSGGSQLVVYLVSWVIGTASLTLSIADIAPGDLVATNLISSLAITTNTTTRLRVSPYIATVNNVIAQAIVPALFQISVAVGSANPADYSLSYSLT